MIDVGIILPSIVLAAQNYGLGCCVEGAVVRYPDILRKILSIPESKRILIGMGIGYPDWNDKVNSFRSEQEPLKSFVSWQGVW